MMSFTAGKVRAVAVLGSKRSAAVPNLPAVTEAVPNVDITPGWFAFWGPPQMPGAIARRVHADLLKAMNAADTRAWYDANGFIYIGSTPEELLAMQKSGHEVFARVVKAAGMKAE